MHIAQHFPPTGSRFVTLLFVSLIVVCTTTTAQSANTSTATSTASNVTACVTANVDVSSQYATFFDCVNSNSATATITLARTFPTTSMAAVPLSLLVEAENSGGGALESWQIEDAASRQLIAYAVGSLGASRTSLVLFFPSVTVTRTWSNNGSTQTLQKAVATLPTWSSVSPVSRLPLTDVGLGRRAILPSTTTYSENTTVEGYLFDCFSVFRVVDTRGINLATTPTSHSKELTMQNFNRNGFCLVTFPTTPPVTPGSQLVQSPFFGTVYPVSSTNVLTIAQFWNNVQREAGLLVRADVTLGSDTRDGITIWSLTDLGVNTPAPTPAPNAVPVKEVTVIAWWVWLVIALGVICAIGICFCLAKRSALRKEDHKKTAKRRKAEQDRFDRMARDMASGIDVDDETRN